MLHKFLMTLFISLKMNYNLDFVVVDCAPGFSRSALIFMAYLTINKSLTYSETFSYVKSKKIVNCPNSGF